jgi:hypothetical protein
MPNKLTDLEVTEISLVDSPANALAKVLITKRKDDEPELVDIAKTPPWHIVERDGAWLVLGVENGKTYGTHDSRAKAIAQLRALYANAAPSEKTEKGGTDTAHVAAVEPQEDDDMSEELKAQVEKLQADLLAATKERDTYKAKVDAAENTPEAIEKRQLDALPASVRKRLEETEAELKQMREARSESEWIAKAKDIGQPTEIGVILKRMSAGQSTVEDVEKIASRLKALAEQARVGKLFATVGSDGNDGDVANDAEGKFMAESKAMAKAESIPLQDAMERVAKNKPDLYAEVREQSYSAKSNERK